MTFTHVEYFALLPLFFLAWIWAKKRRQWLYQPSKNQVKRSNIFSRLTLGVPRVLWLAMTILYILALAKPTGEISSTYIVVEKKVFMMSIDVSTSMGRGPESSMEKIKLIALDFAQRRKGDVIGVSAYSGASFGSRGRGYAAILTRPTDDIDQTDAAVGSLEATMFGPFTAIGDGIFISVIALIEPEAKNALGDRYDRWLLEKSVDSFGTAEENLDYAREVAARVGSQKGKFVLLFTDGKYNTGMNPAKALWFAQQLDIKVHFVAFESSSATGLSIEEQQRRKEEIMKGVVTTGGMYRESSDMAGIAQIFDEIDQAEKSRVILEGEPREDNRARPLIILAALLFCLWVILENTWMKIP